MRKLKENRKKGFTLVELIVVLVILAILAALLVPALTGYIDKAKQKQVVAETRQSVMAAQTLIDESLAKNDIRTIPAEKDIELLAEVKGTVTKLEEADIDQKGHLLWLVYKSKNNLYCAYKATYDADGKLQTSEYTEPSTTVPSKS